MKMRKGFVSNSSSASFIVDYWGETKTTIKEAEEITDRVIKAYNILMQSTISKGKIMKIGTVDDELIRKRKEYIAIDNREYVDDKWVDAPLTGEQIKSIEEQKGKVVIHTKEDNSIPYVLSEMIDALLHTERWHWG